MGFLTYRNRDNKHPLFKPLSCGVIFTQVVTNTTGFILFKKHKSDQEKNIGKCIGKSLGDFSDNKIQPQI